MAMSEHIRECRDRESLGDINALPDWARELLQTMTPYIASDPELWVSHIGNDRCQIYSRDFFYGIDKRRQQII
jgi:hypothetical protein